MRTGAAARVARRVSALAAALPIILLAGACAGSSQADPVGSPTSGDMTLNVGQASDSLGFFPVFVAEHEGYFADEHLALGARSRLRTGPELDAALAGGSIDVAAGVTTDMFALARTGNTPRAVAALAGSYDVDIVVARNTRMPPPGASLAQKVRALKGLNIGIASPGSGTQALVTYLFRQAGMNPGTDATLVSLGSGASTVLGALKTGRVAAVSAFQPTGQEAEAAGIGSIYLSPSRGDIPALAGDVHGMVFTIPAVLASKTRPTEAFVIGVARAEHLIRTASPATVDRLLSAYLPALKPAAVSRLVPVLRQEIPATPAISPAAYQEAVSFYKTTALLDGPPAYSATVASSLISSAMDAVRAGS